MSLFSLEEKKVEWNVLAGHISLEACKICEMWNYLLLHFFPSMNQPITHFSQLTFVSLSKLGLQLQTPVSGSQSELPFTVFSGSHLQAGIRNQH